MHFISTLLFIPQLPFFVSIATLPVSVKVGGGSSGRGGGGGKGGSRSSRSGAGIGRGGSGDTGYPVISYGSVSTSGRSANYFSSRGVSSFTLTGTSFFRDRLMGGDTRSEVPGTRAFGSGYPYSAGTIKGSVAGQLFPFGFWPIYWAGYGRSEEYGINETVSTQRPGGDQVTVELKPNLTSSTWNTTTFNSSNEMYWIIGDRESVTTLLSILIDPHSTYDTVCDVQNSTILAFKSPEPVHFDNVIQWYRSSSFALAFDGYNNSYALSPLNETSDLGWNDSTPLPNQIQYSPFLQCINTTLSAALPILDKEVPPFSATNIATIVFGVIFGSIFLLCCGIPCTQGIKRPLRHEAMKQEQKPAITSISTSGAPGPTTANLSSHETYSHDTPPPLWPTSYSWQQYTSSSLTSSHPSSTTRPESALTKPGRDSFCSSRTLIGHSVTNYDQDNQTLYHK